MSFDLIQNLSLAPQNARLDLAALTAAWGYPQGGKLNYIVQQDNGSLPIFTVVPDLDNANESNIRQFYPQGSYGSSYSGVSSNYGSAYNGVQGQSGNDQVNAEVEVYFEPGFDFNQSQGKIYRLVNANTELRAMWNYRKPGDQTAAFRLFTGDLTTGATFNDVFTTFNVATGQWYKLGFHMDTTALTASIEIDGVTYYSASGVALTNQHGVLCNHNSFFGGGVGQAANNDSYMRLRRQRIWTGKGV